MAGIKTICCRPGRRAYGNSIDADDIARGNLFDNRLGEVGSLSLQLPVQLPNGWRMCDHSTSPLIRRDELVRVLFIGSRLSHPLHGINLADRQLQSNHPEANRLTLRP